MVNPIPTFPLLNQVTSVYNGIIYFIQVFEMLFPLIGLMTILFLYIAAPAFISINQSPWYLVFMGWMLLILISYLLLRPLRTDDDI